MAPLPDRPSDEVPQRPSDELYARATYELPAVREVRVGGYAVTISPGIVDTVGVLAAAATKSHRFAVISDSTVAPLWGARALGSFVAGEARLFTVPAGEAHKTRDQWARLTDELLAAGYGRDAAIVALGGGVVGDLAGFVAATYMRGIPVVQVPTTLLAMIDSSIGGKTGVDTPHGKNLVGAFHPPAAVLADPVLLRTLPEREWRAGLAEALKHGIIADAPYAERVAAIAASGPRDDAAVELVWRSVEIKADVVRRDEREGGVRKTLNLGHTLGHAIEHVDGYAMRHGEAVALGMVLESAIAERLGVASPGTATEVRELVERVGLPATLPPHIAPARVVEATHLDKKVRAGVVEYALPARVGAMAGGDRGWALPVPDALALEVLTRGL